MKYEAIDFSVLEEKRPSYDSMTLSEFNRRANMRIRVHEAPRALEGLGVSILTRNRFGRTDTIILYRDQAEAAIAKAAQVAHRPLTVEDYAEAMEAERLREQEVDSLRDEIQELRELLKRMQNVTRLNDE